MTLYPHEWILMKLKGYKDVACIFYIATVTSLAIGYLTFYVAVNYPTDVWQVQTFNQPSVFSYAPIVVVAIFILVAIGVFPYMEDKKL